MMGTFLNAVVSKTVLEERGRTLLDGEGAHARGREGNAGPQPR